MNRRGLKVFVVEDEALVALLIEELLGRLGHRVVAVARTLREALDLADVVAVDLAILDVNLNGERSFPAADRLRLRNVPLVFATGYGAAGVSELAGVPVVAKPFESLDLERAINAAMSSSD